MAVPPHEAGQADFRLPAIAVDMDVHLLVLDGSPQSFNEDVVVAALPSRPADSDSVSLQAGHEVGGGELAPLIGVEDLWLTATSDAISRASRQNSVSRLFDSFQLSTFLEKRSTIATR